MPMKNVLRQVALSVTLLLAAVPTTALADTATGYVPGTDITDQLRADLDAGLDVSLPAGHFYVSESIFVLNHPGGILKGAGMDQTVIEAAEGFVALPNPLLGGAPTSSMLEYQWATGDVTIKGLTFLVRGDMPAEGHDNPFVGYSTAIDNVIVVHGGGITATLKDIAVRGEHVGDGVPGSINGRNLIYPLIVTGWGASEPTNAIIKNCEIENAGFNAVEFFLGNGGTAVIKDNSIADSFTGILLGWNDGLITVKNNVFRNIDSDPIVNWLSSNVVIKDNVFE